MNRGDFLNKVLLNRLILIFYGFSLLFSAQVTFAFELVEKENRRTPPVITGCPSNITTTISGCSTTSISWTPPIANDPEEGVTSFVSSHNPGDEFFAGVTTVTYTATNTLGETSTCSFKVNVKSNDLFDFTCPSSFSLNMNAGCNNQASWIEPTPSCSGLTVVSTHSPGERFEVGTTTTVTYFAFDGALIVGRCDFDITINDESIPTFSNCPNNIVVASDSNCEAIVSWTAPTAADNCTDNIIPTASHAPGSTFTVGSTLVTYTAIDASGNESTCTFTVTVEDQTAPSFTDFPTDIVVTANEVNCKATASWPTVIAEDNCSGSITIDNSHDPGDLFDLGENTIIYTATDVAGNQNIQSFTVTVVDETPPSVSNCPTNININAGTSCSVPVTWVAPSFTDICDGTLAVESSHNSGDLFNVGTTTVTYTATDDRGNETTCSFDVVVTDITAPVFEICPTNITISTGNNCSATPSWNLPTVSDNCDASVSLTSNFNPGAIFNLGQTTVLYTATDEAGNTAECSFIVTVEDDTPPVFSNCPADINLSANGNCEAIANWAAPSASDNCTNTLTVSESHASGTAFPLGVTVVSYSTTDEAGNQGICTFKVTVTDNTAPNISNCPNNIVLVSDGNCGAIANWTEPIISDNCDSSPTITRSHTSGSRFPIGETVVSYQTIDETGNQNSCEFTIIVNDQIAPTVLSCPSDINLSVGANSCTVNATWNVPSFSDNCNSSITVSSTHSPGDAFSIGTTTVLYTAEDASGNIANCSFNVVVTDGISPVFNTCPGNINLTANENCQAIAEWILPNITDNCTSEVTISSSHNSGDSFPVGITTVTYTATDASGNKSNCSFEVNVRDLAGPIIVSCTDDVFISATENCQTSANWTPPVFSDCSELLITSNFQPGDVFPLGNTEVKYIAIDSNGQSSICNFMVTVEDQRAPNIISCVSNMLIEVSESCNSVVEWELPVAVDNCSEMVSVSSTHQSGDLFDIGNTTVIYTFTDEAGNKANCEFTVTVVDQSIFEVVNCPEDRFIETDESGRANVNWTVPGFIHNNCSDVEIESNYVPGDSFEVGNTIVEYVFTDENGRSINCSFMVEVKIRELAVEASDLLSPNGDGINDNWIIEGLQNFPDNEVIIVDQWGSLIFKTKGYNNQDIVWDGRNRQGDLVPKGTYFYFINVRTQSDSQEKKGFIEIVR